MKELCSLEEVRQVIGDPNPLASKKIYTTLNSRMQEFIKTSPLLMLSTVDEFGFPTISPKGDIAGFVKVRAMPIRFYYQNYVVINWLFHSKI
ncbi:PNPOx family protein [Vibrio mimicus]|uniref:pyridoxamine 5'-phosphate oxidase family protein n=1 Tax=Vibrio mimicus TaxID=674 RepID=UPI0004E3786B|nr:pyridoxamine 5'-phosphate oxidase family protein [Vibrio mimicus]KFE29481.1 pyridoxamine 5'-phosphate oxidase family protein [Vibrio mimicus]